MITTTVARLSVMDGSSVKVGGLPPRRQEHQAKEDKQKYCAKGLQSIAFFCSVPSRTVFPFCLPLGAPCVWRLFSSLACHAVVGLLTWYAGYRTPLLQRLPF